MSYVLYVSEFNEYSEIVGLRRIDETRVVVIPVYPYLLSFDCNVTAGRHFC